MGEGTGPVWRCRDRVIRLGARPLVMGILNVTPDSFSDGGRYLATDAAIQRGLEMAAEGADILDIGGESTRPGAAPVPADEELDRVRPVMAGLCNALPSAGRPLLSVDTRKAVVAEAALAAGADILNDVTALRGDPAMVEVARRYGAGVVLMHMQGDPESMQLDPRYRDVSVEVCEWLRARVAALVEQGLAVETLASDSRGLSLQVGRGRWLLLPDRQAWWAWRRQRRDPVRGVWLGFSPNPRERKQLEAASAPGDWWPQAGSGSGWHQS